MKKVIVIPARLDSSRLPKKVLLDLKGKTVIQRVYEQCLKVSNIDAVYIATDSLEIKDICDTFTSNVMLTKSTHQSGTDRIGEVMAFIDCDIVINVQGDEPFIDSSSLNKLVFELNNSDHVSLMINISDINEINDPNNVKVIVDSENYALYFSRSVIPFCRDVNTAEVTYYKHIGVYGFTKQALVNFSKLPPSKLELVEKIEAIRIVENGSRIKMIETDFLGVGIDTKEDLDLAISIWSKK